MCGIAGFLVKNRMNYGGNLTEQETHMSAAIMSRGPDDSGVWTDKSAGGCHLYHKAFEQKADKFTWTTNPRFHLKLMIE